MASSAPELRINFVPAQKPPPLNGVRRHSLKRCLGMAPPIRSDSERDSGVDVGQASCREICYNTSIFA